MFSPCYENNSLHSKCFHENLPKSFSFKTYCKKLPLKKKPDAVMHVEHEMKAINPR
jgi:hypothetical protein